MHLLGSLSIKYKIPPPPHAATWTSELHGLGNFQDYADALFCIEQAQLERIEPDDVLELTICIQPYPGGVPEG